MNKAKTFKIGDKVFAKIKGYPPWPAIVEGDLTNKRYKVKFYGTNETGQVKSEDIFYYLPNKEKFYKPLKRKDYKEAVEEIEEAIEKSGTDGSDAVAKETNESTNGNETPTRRSSKGRPLKRKRRSTGSSVSDKESSDKKEAKNGLPVTKRLKKEVRSGNVPPVKNDSKEDEPNLNGSGSSGENVQDETCEVVLNGIEFEEVPSPMTNGKSSKRSRASSSPEVELKKFARDVSRKTKKPVASMKVTQDDLLLKTDLNAFVEYGQYVREHEAVFKKLPVVDRNDSRNKVLPVVVGAGRLAGIRFHLQWPVISKNEYERAVYDEEMSTRVLELHRTFVEADLKDEPHVYIDKIDFTEGEIQDFEDAKTVKLKAKVYNALKIESELLKCDIKIKSSLGLKRADAKGALVALQRISSLELSEVILKKHSHVVDMIRRLRKYVGNIENWNLDIASLQTFQEDAYKIRALARTVYQKIKNTVFVSKISKSFWDGFSKLAKEFEETVKEKMDEPEMYLIHSDPNSRDGFVLKNMLQSLNLKIVTGTGNNF